MQTYAPQRGPRPLFLPSTEAHAPRTLLRELAHTLGAPLDVLVELRVRDVDLERGCVFVPGHAPCPLTPALIERFRPQLEHARRMHRLDMRAGLGGVPVPAWCDPELVSGLPQWYFVFPSPRVRQGPDGVWRREPMRAHMPSRGAKTQTPRPEDRGRRQR